jgi:hypothetical protein
MEDAMEHKTLDEIRATSRTAPTEAVGRHMGRREKLEHWATLLEHHKGQLKPLGGIEFLSAEMRSTLRGDNSPLAVAYGDPTFRVQGLTSDRLGDGMTFFELTNWEGHRLLCDCHYGGKMIATELAARLRYAARHPMLFRFFNWM